VSDVQIVTADPRWALEFDAFAADLRSTLGPLAVRIDHIGSTSVPGLDAKDVIDVQIGVADAADLAGVCAALAVVGHPVTPDARDHPLAGTALPEPAWTKGFATQRPGQRRANIHVRVVGAANFRYALLFRDYLRQHPAAAAAYAAFKRQAAALLPDDTATYADLKDPVCDLICLPAQDWAERSSWTGDHTHPPPQYDAFAAEFEQHARVSPYNASYDRPALLDLLGDVSGRRVLDVGCGPGLHATELLARGALVSGFDESPEMVRLARARLGSTCDVRVARLGESLDWLADASQDVVVMALVLHHVDERVDALRELHRVLRPTGRLVVSTTHPTADWRRLGGSYFTVEAIDETWQADWQVRFWRAPLERWCAEFADAGFVIERLVEPRPVPALAVSDPDRYQQLMREPGFIAFRLAKASA